MKEFLEQLILNSPSIADNQEAKLYTFIDDISENTCIKLLGTLLSIVPKLKSADIIKNYTEAQMALNENYSANSDPMILLNLAEQWQEKLSGMKEKFV